MFRALRLCICLSVGHNREPIKPTQVHFGIWTRVNPQNRVLDGGPDPPGQEALCGISLSTVSV